MAAQHSISARSRVSHRKADAGKKWDGQDHSEEPELHVHVKLSSKQVPMSYLALHHRNLEDKTVSRPPNVFFFLLFKKKREREQGILKIVFFFLQFNCSVLSDSFATPWTLAPQGSSVDRVSQERMLEWVAIIQLQYQHLKHIVPSKKVKVIFYLYVK